MKDPRSHLAITLAGLLLAGCGGGGGDPPPVTLYAVSAAQAQLLSAANRWTVNGKAPDGTSFTVQIDFAPMAAGNFPIGGMPSSLTRETLTLASGGTVSDISGPTYYFDKTTLAVFGSDNGDLTCSIATSNTALPASAAVGASGPAFSFNDLDGCQAGSIPVGTTTTRWSLESDSGVALLCWNQTVTGATDGTVSTCVEIAAGGSLGGKARFAVKAAALTLSARNF